MVRGLTLTFTSEKGGRGLREASMTFAPVSLLRSEGRRGLSRTPRREGGEPPRGVGSPPPARAWWLVVTPIAGREGGLWGLDGGSARGVGRLLVPDAGGPATDQFGSLSNFESLKSNIWQKASYLCRN